MAKIPFVCLIIFCIPFLLLETLNASKFSISAAENLSSINTYEENLLGEKIFYGDFPSFKMFIEKIQKNSKNLTIEIHSDLIISEPIEIYQNFIFNSNEHRKFSLNFTLTGRIHIFSSDSINFHRIIINATNLKYTVPFASFSIENASEISFINCIVWGDFHSFLKIMWAQHIVISDCYFRVNSSESKMFILINNGLFFKINECIFEYSYIFDAFFISSNAIDNYIMNFMVHNNTFTNSLKNEKFSVISASNNIHFENITFINNKFSMILFLNSDFIESITFKNISFQENIYITMDSTINAMIFIQNGIVCEILSASFYGNIVDKNLVFIQNFKKILLQYIDLIDNLSEFAIYIQQIQSLIIQTLLCHRNNNKSSSNIAVGSCIFIRNSPSILINSIKISQSIGLKEIPGVLIVDDSIKSTNISINYSIFINNFFLKTYSGFTNSIGCALYVSGSHALNLFNDYFYNNFAVMIEENLGGPVLFFNSREKSSFVNLTHCLSERNFALKRSLAIEFDGLCLFINNSSFIGSSEYIPKNENQFYTESLLNGIAQKIYITNIIIAYNVAADGIFFLYERKFLIFEMNKVKIIKNNGSLSAGFLCNFESKNRTLIFKNSFFIANSIDVGATFAYISVFSMIIKFELHIINATIEQNYADPISFGLIDYWTYSNNLSFYLINSSIRNNIYPYYRGEFGLVNFYGINVLINILISDSICSYNHVGHLVFVFYKCSVVYEKFIFTNNLVPDIQPIFYNQYTRFSMKNALISNNSAEGYYYQFLGKSECVISNVIFEKNKMNHYLVECSDSYNVEIYNFFIHNIESGNHSYNILSFNAVSNVKLENISVINCFGDFLAIINNYQSNGEFKNILFISDDFNYTGKTPFLKVIQSEFKISSLFICLKNVNKMNQLIYVYASNFLQSGLQINIEQNFSCFNVFYVVKSECRLENNSIFNISSLAKKYFFYALQSKLILNSNYIEKNKNIFFAKQCNISIHRSFFQNIKEFQQIIAKYVFILQNNYEFCMDSVIFQNFYCENSPISIENSLRNKITNSVFMNNSAVFSLGGAFSVKTSKILLENCTFSLNLAQEGGACYFECELKNSKNCEFSLISNIFLRNIAILDGGAFKYQYIQPITNKNRFINNSALFGSNFSSYFCKLGFEVFANNELIFTSFGNNSTDLLILTNISSNKNQNYWFRLYPLDTYNQIIKKRISQQVSIEISNGLWEKEKLLDNFKQSHTINDSFFCTNSKVFKYIGPLNKLQNENFSYIFQDFKIISCPTSLIFLKFITNFSTITSDSLFQPSSLNEILNKNQQYSIEIPIYLDKCRRGEFYFPLKAQCQVCPEKTYSDTEKTLVCKPCLLNTNCQGGENFSVNFGFWNEINYKENIYHCNIFAGNCLGGVETKCNEQYSGILCDICVKKANGNIFYKNYVGECKQCPAFLIIVAVYAVIIAICTLIIRFIMKKFEDENTKNDDRFILKTFVNFFQFLYFISFDFSQLKVVISDDLVRIILKHASFFHDVRSLYISFDCIYYLFNDSGPNNPFLDETFIFCVFYLICLVYYLFLNRKKIEKEKIKRKFQMIFYIVFPFGIKMLSDCVSLENINGRHYVKINKEFQYHQVLFIYCLFIIPNLIINIVSLFIFTVYNQKPKKIKIPEHRIKEIFSIGLKNPFVYETLNLITWVFFLLVKIYPFSQSIREPIIYFFVLYRILAEIYKCKFTTKKYAKINVICKSFMIFDLTIVFYLTSNQNIDLVFYLFIIEFVFLAGIVIFLFLMLLKCRCLNSFYFGKEIVNKSVYSKEKNKLKSYFHNKIKKIK